MPYSKRNNAPKTRVLNNLKPNLSEQLRDAGSIAWLLWRNTDSEFDIDNTTVDNDISTFNDAIGFIQFNFNNMLKPNK